MSRSQWAADKTRTLRLQVPAIGHAQLHDKACDMKYSKPCVLNSSQPSKTLVRRQAVRNTKLSCEVSRGRCSELKAFNLVWNRPPRSRSAIPPPAPAPGRRR